MTPYFGLENSPQHQTSTTLLGLVRENRPTPLLPPLSAVFSHIHSKTACRGFKSFCPCQKSQVSLLRCLTFSLVCGRIWQRGAPAGPPAVRVVGRVRASGTQATSRPRRQPRPSPSALLLGFPIRSPLSPTAPIPSSTRNAPGLAFFWLNRVRFSLFRWFLGAKFLSWFLCILPHSGHRLKPSVIPCRREVSFLT